MVEKKFVIENLPFSYNGPCSIPEFYKYVDEWINNNHMEKELKKKTELVKPKGKEIEWFIEIWEKPADYAKRVVRLRALFTDVKEMKVKNRVFNTADVMIVIDGILETDIQGRWQQKPVYYVIRAIYDKFLNKFYTNKFEAKIAADCYKLQRHIRDFFKSFSQKINA